MGIGYMGWSFDQEFEPDDFGFSGIDAQIGGPFGYEFVFGARYYIQNNIGVVGSWLSNGIKRGSSNQNLVKSY